MVVGTEDHVCGLIAVADTIRPEAKGVRPALRAAGIQAVVMLTGDNRGTAEAIGAAGRASTRCRPSCCPTEKVEAIDELSPRYGQVAMIGDGVNDAPAMARATLGVAMGATGATRPSRPPTSP